jgi:integrase
MGGTRAADRLTAAACTPGPGADQVQTSSTRQKAPTRRVKLTGGRVRDFYCPTDQKQAFLWDSLVPSLAVRATRGGSRAYVFQAKLRGEVVRITLGPVDSWSLDSADPARPGARQEARRLRTLVDRHLDPRVERAEQDRAAHAAKLQADLHETTVGDVWKEYVAARRDKWGARHLLDHERLADPGGRPALRGNRKTDPGALAALMPVRLVDLDADRVRAWLGPEVQSRPTQARLAFGALRAFVNWCADSTAYRGLVHADACTKRVAKSTLPKKGVKSDCLQREQLPAWFAAVRALPDPVVAAYLQALLLTGARREELATLTWPAVDFKWKVITIRDKVEGERQVPLTPYVAHLLGGLKAINEPPPNVAKLGPADGEHEAEWKPSPWVFFSSTAVGGRLVEPRTGHNRALAAGGLPHLTLHGLRRSFATLSEWVEVPAGVVAQIMGHKPSATAERHYKRRPIDLLRVWHDKIEAWTLKEAGIRFKPLKAERLLHLVAADTERRKA